jgi:hypothetical protein
MLMTEIDLTDWKNPHLSEINGVLMDTRFLGNRVLGTKAHWLKKNLHLGIYCKACYTISTSPYDHRTHFKRRVHVQATNPTKKAKRTLNK